MTSDLAVHTHPGNKAAGLTLSVSGIYAERKYRIFHEKRLKYSKSDSEV